MGNAAPHQPTEAELLSTSAGYVQTFPAPGLRRTIRHVTGHNAEGKGIFMTTDCGEHHRIIGNEQALANIVYSTKETPVDLANDADLKYAKENEVRRELPAITFECCILLFLPCLTLDFSPDFTSTMAPLCA